MKKKKMFHTISLSLSVFNGKIHLSDQVRLDV